MINKEILARRMLEAIDTWRCPADFCPWDEKCFRYQTFEEIEKLLCQVDTFLAEAGSYV